MWKMNGKDKRTCDWVGGTCQKIFNPATKPWQELTTSTSTCPSVEAAVGMIYMGNYGTSAVQGSYCRVHHKPTDTYRAGTFANGIPNASDSELERSCGGKEAMGYAYQECGKWRCKVACCLTQAEEEAAVGMIYMGNYGTSAVQGSYCRVHHKPTDTY